MPPHTSFRILAAFFLLICFHSGVSGQWTTRAASPNPRWGPCSCSYNGEVYLFGGTVSAQVNTAEKYNPGTNTWTTLAGMPQAISYCAAVSASNGKIYVFGGNNGSVWLNYNQEYDPITNTWTMRAPMPVNSMGLGAAEANGKIYVQGGWNGVLLNNNQEYDFVTNTWAARTALSQARYQVSCAQTGGLVYCVGGYTSAVVGTNDAYNPVSNTIAVRAPLATPRYLHGVAAMGGQVYVAGGFPNTGTAERYTPASNTWAYISNINQARYRITATATPTCVYALAGYTGSVTVGTNEEFCGSVLDENIIRLEATEKENGIAFSWTSFTANASKDIVEFSLDGISFQAMAEISAGQTTHWTDEENHEGFFRIRRYLFSGESIFSNTLEVADGMDNEPGFVFLPSWRDDVVFVEFCNATGPFVEFNIYSADGKLAGHAEMLNPPPGKQVLPITMEAAGGVYLVTMKTTQAMQSRRLWLTR